MPATKKPLDKIWMKGAGYENVMVTSSFPMSLVREFWDAVQREDEEEMDRIFEAVADRTSATAADLFCTGIRVHDDQHLNKALKKVENGKYFMGGEDDLFAVFASTKKGAVEAFREECGDENEEEFDW